MNINKLLKAFLTLTACFLFLSTHAQVTVGAGLDPNKGALLDLKQEDINGASAQLGLLLSKTTLTDLNKFGLLSPEPQDAKVYKGLVLFHQDENSSTIPQGIYIWDGAKWVFTPSQWSRDKISQ